MKPTEETYERLAEAYAWFNQRLFDSRLPSCLITLNRKKGTYGYFWGGSWKRSSEEELTDEIALNPDTFQTCTLKDVLSTVVHEQCHLEQHHFGKPSRSGYHNAEWGAMMERVGLIPSDTGQPGGKKTGQKMNHYVADGGLFDVACDELIASGFSIPWATVVIDVEKAAKKRKSKTKYTCPSCGVNAWAKPLTNLMCGSCEVHLIAEEEPERLERGDV